MKTWIALLRGVNVGGKNKLPMKMLAAELETIGLSDIKTYLQSGNVVFRCPDGQATDLAEEIGTVIQAKFGFPCQVIVLSADQLAASMTANPFPEAATETEGKTLHFFFLSRAPLAVNEDRLNAARRGNERWQIMDNVFYLHTPEGFGDSKLAVQAERILGVPATARNWHTVHALLNLVH